MREKQKTIILVEDDAIIALSQKRDLIKRGYKVIHTSTGEKAVEFLKLDSQKINLILMDIDLGKGIDGTQAAREILKLKEIPIVFLSSHTELPLMVMLLKIPVLQFWMHLLRWHLNFLMLIKIY